jgi:predicted CoA-binding protein
MTETSESPLPNPSAEEIRELLRATHTIAVVGLSDSPARASHRVAAYLKAHGYHIIPVNPNVAEVFDEEAYPSLRDVPEKIDLVDVFRRPEHVPGVVEDAIAVGAKAVWLQEGIVHNAAARRAREAGLQMVMNRCLMVEHRMLGD